MLLTRTRGAVLLAVLVVAVAGRLAVGAAAAHMVYLRGPGDPDCAGELTRARQRGDASGVFLAEFKCKIQPAWKCPASCKGDELLVTHVTVKVQRDGQPADGQVVRNSESKDFDQMSLAAVKAGAPFPAPPQPLLDGSGAAALKIEFACDCAERPRPGK
jgi:TonB family protein